MNRRKNRQYLLILFLFIAVPIRAQVKTGIEVLKELNFAPLQGKRVGLITNPTGVDSSLRSTIDILHDAPNVNLVALYGPEHGVRGDAHAGDKVKNDRDPSTGLPVYSLYGTTRKPSTEMLKGVDVLVYDIQDIGCRSFTYISTMGLAMEAAAEAGIEFMVLDRPNPLGGIRIEGSIAEKGFLSFVSPYPIPYIYGLTCGELAMMLNEEKMLSGVCKLSIVTMGGWSRSMTYEDTKLPWVLSSPHIPHASTAYFYPLSGILGELGIISIGVGYTLPFEVFAAEWMDADKLANALNAHALPGVIFRPIHFKPFYATSKGVNVHGVQVHITDPSQASLSPIQFLVMQESYRLYPDHPFFTEQTKGRFDMFDKVVGSDHIRREFSKRYIWEDVKAYWNKDVESFRKLSHKYYLYK